MQHASIIDTGNVIRQAMHPVNAPRTKAATNMTTPLIVQAGIGFERLNAMWTQHGCNLRFDDMLTSSLAPELLRLTAIRLNNSNRKQEPFLRKLIEVSA